MRNPFLTSPAQKPGHGTVYLALLAPSTPVLQTLEYQYPLKLISPAPLTITVPSLTATTSDNNGTITTNSSSTQSPQLQKDHHQQQQEQEQEKHLIHTIYTLTYGGGLVAGDTITLSLTLSPHTRLISLTQGSTKIFKSPSRDVVSAQTTRVEIGAEAGLVVLPDPVQPFERSCFRQVGVYDILPVSSTAAEEEGGVNGKGRGTTALKREKRGSLCVLDWVSCGRAARGEDWGFWKYGSRNEVYLISDDNEDHHIPSAQGGTDGNTKTTTTPSGRKRRLLLRDNLTLDIEAEEQQVGSIAARMDGMGVFGTLILYGALFERLGKFFMAEFKVLPRIGNRKWDSGSGDEEDTTEAEVKRRARQKQETLDGLLWSAAAVRGCVVVKFGAREVEGGRMWIRTMLETEGSVIEQFGERAMMCLR